MATPRSESIRSYRSGEPSLARDPRLHGEAAYKIDQYAHLARFIDDGIDRFLSDDESVGFVVNATTRENIAQNFTLLLQRSIRSDEYRAVVEAHERRGITGIDGLMHAGIGTALKTSQAVYDSINTAAGEEAAGLPGNSALLDRLAKLDFEQFSPYANYYLYSFGRQAFIDHIKRTGDGFRFKTGYPLAAEIPLAFSHLGSDSPYVDSREMANSPSITVGDIPTSAATIGCPVTFNPRRMPELWQTYVRARENLSKRQRFGGRVINGINSGDNAG